jgi:Ras family protein T1
LGEGVNEHGITWTGFLFLHQLHIDKRHLEITWTILRKFGYNNDLKLAEDVIPSTSQRAPDQVIYIVGGNYNYYKAMALLEMINDLLCAEIIYLF